MHEPTSDVEPFAQWAIVEIFGHTRLAGLVSEASIGGCAFLRVDVPACEGHQGFTRYYGNAAIYSMTIVSKEVAYEALAVLRPKPIMNFALPRLQAPVYDQRDLYDDDRDTRGRAEEDVDFPF